MSAPAVTVKGPLAEVAFNVFDLDAYRLFLRCKQLPESQLAYDWERDTYTLSTPARFAGLLGAEVPARDVAPLPLAEHLFDYQAWIVRRALEARRFAVWCDTGLGKTAIYLEWVRQVLHETGGRVLILCPLQVIPQTVEMAGTFYGDGLSFEVIQTRERLAEWCKDGPSNLAITNYEKLIPGQIPEMRYLSGVVADESSMLKSGGGVTKWNLIHSSKGIEYKLSCTATPAPNDSMEYASQASFLEKLRAAGDILWTWFVRDKQGDWRVKPHARNDFYRFMASWSVYMRNPVAFGFADILKDLPAPEIHEEIIPLTPVQEELRWSFIARKGSGLFADDRLGVAERTKLSQMAKGFLYDGQGKERTAARIESRKPAHVAATVLREVAEGRQVLVWTVFDEESEIIAAHLADALCEVGTLHGRMSDAERLNVLERFRHGELAVLISKAQLIGFGLNLQFCRSMVFSGFDDSFERMYQAIRRAYRFGQTETVRVFVPYIPELEGMVFSNVRRKQAQFDRDTAECEAAYRTALEELPSLGERTETSTEEVWRPVVGWESLYEVSSIGRVRRITDAPTGGYKAGRIMAAQPLPKGYLQVRLSKDGQTTHCYVHRLVCEAFHGPAPTPEHQVAHGNGVPDDNRYENLRWATADENMQDAVEHGTASRGERHGMHKLSRADVEQVFRLRAEGLSQSEIGRRLGIGQPHVSDILRGKRWREVGAAMGELLPGEVAA